MTRSSPLPPAPNGPLPGLEELKQHAKRLRASLAEDGDFVSHGEALEYVARQHGYRNWNTLHAAVGNRRPPPPITVGARVRGRYLGQPFDGEVVGVERLSGDRLRVTVEFDTPVDVVTFDSFSNYRSRVSTVVGKTGVSAERTSNGEPHMAMEVVR